MESNNRSENYKNDEKYDVTFEEAMDVVDTGYFQYKVTVIGGVIILTSYITSNVVAFVLPVAQCDLHMDSQNKGRLASVFFVGIILTCHLWGFLSDTMGRRYVLIRCLFIDGILYLLTMLTPNFYIILFLRFINGITSCGGIVSVYAYIGEFQTTKFRSTSLMLASFLASFGFILMPGVAWLILPATWQFQLYPGHIMRPWKLFYIICGVPSIVSAVGLYFLPESPKFLLAKGEKGKVIEILQNMYKVNDKKSDVFPIKNIKSNEAERIGRLEDNQNKVFAVVKLIWNQTAPLLKKPYRFNLILLLLSFYATIYCNNGMYVWVPSAINKMELYKSDTGNQEGTYCDVLQHDKQKYKSNYHYNRNLTTDVSGLHHIIKSFGNGIKKNEVFCDDSVDTSVYLIYLILGLCLTATWIVVTIINKFANKKYLMMVLMMLTIAAELSLKVSNELHTIAIKACLVIIGSGSVFPLLNSVVVDLFPTNLRAMAGCLTMLTCRLGSMSTHTVSGILIESHCEILVWLYVAFTTVNLLAVSCLPAKPPEDFNNKQPKMRNGDA